MFPPSSHFIFTTIPEGLELLLLFIDRGKEAQRGEGACPESHSSNAAELASRLPVLYLIRDTRQHLILNVLALY